MSTEKTTYKGVTLPEGFAPTKIDGEDSIDDGLVITDGYGNEYVWVEVPKTEAVYPTAGLNITNTNAKYSINYGSSFSACPYSKTSNEYVLLTTGADESFSLMNIYDIAGNVWEWTLEKTSNDNYPCAYRGGSHSNNGSDNPASDRNCSITSYSDNNLGFRLSLY